MYTSLGLLPPRVAHPFVPPVRGMPPRIGPAPAYRPTTPTVMPTFQPYHPPTRVVQPMMFTRRPAISRFQFQQEWKRRAELLALQRGFRTTAELQAAAARNAALAAELAALQAQVAAQTTPPAITTTSPSTTAATSPSSISPTSPEADLTPAQDAGTAAEAAATTPDPTPPHSKKLLVIGLIAVAGAGVAGYVIIKRRKARTAA